MIVKKKIPLVLITLILILSLPVQVFAMTYINSPIVVDSAGYVGEYTSMVLVDGFPAISYYDESNRNLKFVRATSVDGSTWGAPQTVDNNISVGRYSSMAIVNGYPAISYYDLRYYNLKFIRATSADGSTWNFPQTVDNSTDVGRYPSLAVVNGYPAISYYDRQNRNLMFIRATDANGAAWDAPQTLDSAGDTGFDTSLAVVNGFPTISYYDDSNGDLKLIRATDANGTAWESPQTLDSSGDVGLYTSLAVVNGVPAISYYDYSTSALKFIRATDANGTTWESPQTLDSNGIVGRYPSLAVVNGVPAISYYDATNSALKFIRATNANGTTWESPLILDNREEDGLDSSLIMVNGNPAISYCDYTNRDLKYIYVSDFVDISITVGGNPVNTGDTLDYGSTTLNHPITRTFTINNAGNSALDLTRLSLPTGFSLTGNYPEAIAAGSSDDIQIRLDAIQAGTFSGNLQIGSIDTNSSPFNITLTGEVTEDVLETGIISPLDGSTIIDSQLQVAFNHDVLHDGSADAADNPVNYLLVEDGANGLFETVTCLAGVDGDDVQQTITSVTYDAGTFIATINTDPLPAGHYQLLVCGTASIEDATGNVLNGGLFDSTTAFTVVSASGSGSGSTTAAAALLPATGFAPGTQTSLPTQPAHLAYNEMDSLTLQIPSLKVNIPIVGVPQTANGWDVTWLTTAQAGWLNGTAYPTWDGNTVITGHVTNASGNPGPFAEVKSLKFGDEITIQAYGETYTYEVRENKLVTSDNLSVVEEHKSRDWVTLITCEYFNETTGQYLFRRVIRAVLVEVE